MLPVLRLARVCGGTAFYRSLFRPKHGQQHLESLASRDRVGHVGRHDEDFALLDGHGLLADAEFARSLDDLNKCVERSRVLAQSLAFVEGGQGDGSRVVFQQDAADDRPGGEIDQPAEVHGFRVRDLRRFFAFGAHGDAFRRF